MEDASLYVLHDVEWRAYDRRVLTKMQGSGDGDWCREEGGENAILSVYGMCGREGWWWWLFAENKCVVIGSRLRYNMGVLVIYCYVRGM